MRAQGPNAQCMHYRNVHDMSSWSLVTNILKRYGVYLKQSLIGSRAGIQTADLSVHNSSRPLCHLSYRASGPKVPPEIKVQILFRGAWWYSGLRHQLQMFESRGGVHFFFSQFRRTHAMAELAVRSLHDQLIAEAWGLILIFSKNCNPYLIFTYLIFTTRTYSSLVFADSRLKFCFSFTQDSYKSFLLRHGSFSYVIYCVKVEGFQTANDKEKAVCKGECEARRKSAEGRVYLTKAHRRHNNLVYTKRQKGIYRQSPV